ncbi:FtsX-like permease family protein [Lachnospiraceae bacterium ZAX-1]
MKPQTLSAFNIALFNIRRRYFRAFCMAGLVAVLSFVLIGGTLIAVSLSQGIRSISNRLGADALFVPLGYEQHIEGALLRGEPSAFYFEGEIIEKLRAFDGIEKASPQLFIASFDSPHCSAEVQMIGYDAQTDFVIAPWLTRAVSGGPGKGEVVVGSSINGDTGDVLQFFSSDYTVVGKLEKTGMGFDTSVFLNMDVARLALQEYVSYGGEGVSGEVADAVSSIAVDVKSGVDVMEFAKEARRAFHDERVSVVLPQTMIGSLSGNMKSLLLVIAVLIVFLWALAVAVLALTFTGILGERKREFGIYRVLGATRGKLAWIILSESCILSLLGAVVGAALLALFFFSFSPLISLTLDMPYLVPSGVTLFLLFSGGLLVSFLTGPIASLFSALRIGHIATNAIMREGE